MAKLSLLLGFSRQWVGVLDECSTLLLSNCLQNVFVFDCKLGWRLNWVVMLKVLAEPVKKSEELNDN